jgi:hypothetical protein
MIDVYCISHCRWERVTFDQSHPIALNEDVEQEHHFTDPSRTYMHEGRKSDCELCKAVITESGETFDKERFAESLNAEKRGTTR